MTEPSLADRAYESIKNAIITCDLPIGEQLAQSKLADKYQIGLTPIREALHRLAQEGFVQSIPRLGYIVTPVTVVDLKEMFELREILEAAAVRLAATRASAEQLDHLADMANFTYVYHDRASYSLFLNQNAQYHAAVAEVAGNRRLADAIGRVLGELTRVFHMGLDVRDSAEEMKAEHLELSDALCARSPDRAEEIVRQQITRSQQRIIDGLMRSGPTGPARGLGFSV